MSVRKIPSGKWSAQLRVAGYKNRSASFATEIEARDWLVEEKRKLSIEKPTHTFYQMGERYCSVGLKGKPTQQESLDRLKRLCACFDKLSLPSKVDEIQKEHINDFRIYRLRFVVPATCRKDLLFISRIYKWAKAELLLPLANPVDGVTLPPNGKSRNRVVERHELELLMAALPPIMATIVEVAYETAMRRSEIVKLTPRDLNLDERFLSVVDGKTGDRVVPLTKRAIAILQAAKDECPSPTAKLFPVAPHSVSTAFRRARQQVGLDDDVRLHQLRHTRITQVARKGFNQAQIMMVSGHRDSRSVQRYTHLNVKDVLDLID